VEIAQGKFVNSPREMPGVTLMDHHPVVIVGAGPAGLTAAYELVRRDIRPIVLEKADKVGGLARTESYRGYHFDIGGHRFFTKSEEVQRLWQDMLGEDFLKASRLSRIYYRGRFFDYPLDFFNTLSNLGILESLLILLSYFRAQLWPYSEEETFEQWVTNRFGRRLYETFFQTYTEKVWGIPCHEIRSEWAVQRIKGLSLTTAVANALLGTNQARSLINEFHYPVLGPGMMWQRFREVVEDHGGQVLLDTDAIRFRREGQHIKSVVARRDGRTIEIAGEHFITSVPLTELIARLDPPPPADVLQAAGKLDYRAFIIVELIVDQANLFSDNWIYVHSPEVKVGRIQNFKNWSAAMVCDPYKTSLGLEYFCTEGDDIWTMPDDELIALATDELALLGLANTEDVEDGVVLRQPRAYPVYDSEYHEQRQVLKDFLLTIDNLQTIGRNGMHRYNNMDHSMHTGILAVQNVLGADHDLWEANEEEGYLEEDEETQTGQLIPEEVLVRAFARLDKLAFGVAVGAVSGLLVFLATVWLIVKGGDVAGPTLSLLGQYFLGYTVTIKGAFIGSGYAFVCGFLFGWLFAYLRNLFLAFYVYRVRKRAELLSLRDFLDHS
jgi:protoporphyrinogen oxidase